MHTYVIVLGVAATIVAFGLLGLLIVTKDALISEATPECDENNPNLFINFDIDKFLEMTSGYLRSYLSFWEIIEGKEAFRKKINKMLY